MAMTLYVPTWIISVENIIHKIVCLFVIHMFIYILILTFVCLSFCLFVIFPHFIFVFKGSKASTEMGNYPSTSTITRDPMYINVTESNLSVLPSTESSLSELPSDHVYERLRRWGVWEPFFQYWSENCYNFSSGFLKFWW
jgi:hypothetical protein